MRPDEFPCSMCGNVVSRSSNKKGSRQCLPCRLLDQQRRRVEKRPGETVIGKRPYCRKFPYRFPEPPLKVCTECRETKSVMEFREFFPFLRGASAARTRRGWCYACENARSRKAYAALTKEKKALRARKHREFHIRSQYGLTPEQYLQMQQTQKGRCAICGIVPERWNVDHDHKTQQVRALLCLNCNGILGLAKDNVQTLHSAVTYLLKHRMQLVDAI